MATVTSSILHAYSRYSKTLFLVKNEFVGKAKLTSTLNKTGKLP